MNYSVIKEGTINSIRRYVSEGIPTGDFLFAVLTNNLFEAVGRADEDNLRTLPEICCYVYNEIPSLCWGNKEKVTEWLANKEMERRGE